MNKNEVVVVERRTGPPQDQSRVTCTVRLKLQWPTRVEEESESIISGSPLPVCAPCGEAFFSFSSLPPLLYPHLFFFSTFLRTPILPFLSLFLSLLRERRRDISADEDAEQKSDRVQVQGQILKRIFKRKFRFFDGIETVAFSFKMSDNILCLILLNYRSIIAIIAK